MISSKIKKVIDTAISNYTQARKNFYRIKDKYPKYLKGNDNIIGVIGEYYAMLYLEHEGRNPVKVNNRNQKSYDLLCDKTRISVKIITAENSTQISSKIKFGWDELILIIMNEEYRPIKLGHLLHSDYEKGRKKYKYWSKEPYAKTSMLNKRGAISKYGKVVKMSPDIYSFLINFTGGIL